MNIKNNAVHSKESREILRGNLIDAQNTYNTTLVTTVVEPSRRSRILRIYSYSKAFVAKTAHATM